MIKIQPLSSLPDITFADPDVAAVERVLFEKYEQITGRTLYPGNPERLFLDSLAVEISRILYIVDWTGKQNLLKYSEGDFLENLGAFFRATRLSAQKAKTTVKFNLSETLGFDVSIPEGTRVTPDSQVIFETTASATIPAGELSVSAEATCQTAGKSGNGYLPGQVNQLVDLVPYVARVENETLSLGGADAETDDQLRDRIHLAPESFSCAGPEGAFIYHARSVSPLIKDVSVHIPEPGRVVVTILLADGEFPGPELIADIFNALSDKKVRPLTDTVIVQAPTAVSYDLAMSYWIMAEHGRNELKIKANVEAQIIAWKAWQGAALGRSIRPSVLIDYVQSIQGVHHVEVSSPAYQALEPWEVARIGAETITYGGLVDD